MPRKTNYKTATKTRETRIFWTLKDERGNNRERLVIVNETCTGYSDTKRSGQIQEERDDRPHEKTQIVNDEEEEISR